MKSAFKCSHVKYVGRNVISYFHLSPCSCFPPFRFQYLLAIQRKRKIVDSPPHVLLFLSGQAASHIPDFPSFFHTNMYTQRVQLFPLEGNPARVEINVSFLCMFILSSCHKNTNLPLDPPPVFSGAFDAGGRTLR